MLNIVLIVQIATFNLGARNILVQSTTLNYPDQVTQCDVCLTPSPSTITAQADRSSDFFKSYSSLMKVVVSHPGHSRPRPVAQALSAMFTANQLILLVVVYMYVCVSDINSAFRFFNGKCC